MSAAEILHLSRTKAKVLFHGLSSNFFDRANNLALWSIAEMFIDSCLTPMTSSVLADHQDLFRGNNNMIFTVHMSCKLTPAVHLVSKYNKYKILACPTIFQMGRTSSVLKVTLSNYLNMERWGEFYIKYVHINGNSRRPQPFPDWYVSRFADVVNKQTLPTFPSIPEMPEDAYSTTVLTRFSDFDRNGHVATRQYFNFFTDCATEAAFGKYYTHFAHDMCWYPVMAFDVSMLGESQAGELLTIRTWQDRKDPTNVFFSCFKDGNCVTKAVFVYSLTRMEPKVSTNM